jgi:hypothetical protein
VAPIAGQFNSLNPPVLIAGFPDQIPCGINTAVVDKQQVTVVRNLAKINQFTQFPVQSGKAVRKCLLLIETGNNYRQLWGEDRLH